MCVLSWVSYNLKLRNININLNFGFNLRNWKNQGTKIHKLIKREITITTKKKKKHYSPQLFFDQARNDIKAKSCLNHVHNQSIKVLVKDKPNPSLYNKWVRKDGGEDHHWEEFMARPWPFFANVSATMFPSLRTWVKEHLICRGGQKN